MHRCFLQLLLLRNASVFKQFLFQATTVAALLTYSKQSALSFNMLLEVPLQIHLISLLTLLHIYLTYLKLPAYYYPCPYSTRPLRADFLSPLLVVHNTCSIR
jgi:hypothetical protein